MPHNQEPLALTERQQQVLELLDRRVPIKAIAGEIGISQTRVNQHIAALKSRMEANDLSELVTRYREHRYKASPGPLRKNACTKRQLPGRDNASHPTQRAAECDLVLADVHTFSVEAPWAGAREPLVVPRMLDGDHAASRRLLLMVGLAAAIMAAVILTISAAVTVGDLLDGVANVPVDHFGATD